MQLSGGARPARARPGPLPGPRARALLALAVIAAPALSTVLPEERADGMWHYYNGGDITVDGPEVLVRKNFGDTVSLSAGYYEDMISSASIDVKLSASPYHETRKQETYGIDYLHGKTIYSAGVIHSHEPDYTANTTYYSVQQDMFGDLTTVTLGYLRGWDNIYRDIKNADGAIVNDPTFHEQANHRGYSFGMTQILTRNLIANFNYQLLTDQGYLANPYRKIRYAPEGSKVNTLADQVYPDTRTSNSASIQTKYYLPWRAAWGLQYRYFQDTWGVHANTVETDYTWPAWKNWIFNGSFRWYQQSHADFYSDLFPRANYQNFMARDRELAAFHSYTVGAGATYQFSVAKLPWVKQSTLNFDYEHLTVDYSDFRNALLTGEYGAGKEPLYKLNANVFQAFISIWY